MDLQEFENKLRLERLAESSIQCYLKTALFLENWKKENLAQNKKFKFTRAALEELLINSTPSKHNAILAVLRKQVRYKLLEQSLIDGLTKIPLKSRVKNAEELISRDELKLIIDHAANSRDKAFFACLFETQCRSGELETLERKNVIRTKTHYKFMIQKTKTRTAKTVYVVEFQNLLTQFLNDRGDWSGLFFCYKHDNLDYKELPFSELPPDEQLAISEKLRHVYRRRLKRICSRANLDKHIYKHLFRPSGSVDKIRMGIDSVEVKKHGGWSPTSTTFEKDYLRLADEDVENSILEKFGLKQDRDKSVKLTICPVCRQSNSQLSERCANCGNVLILSYDMPEDELLVKIRESEEVREAIIQVIINYKKGRKEKEKP